MIAAKLRPGMTIRWRGEHVKVLDVGRTTRSGLRASHYLFVAVEHDDGTVNTARFYDNDEIHEVRP
jgi:translation elongation factor P/translation initiation factor 5A